MKKREKHAEHDNEERWLLTYADLITLLLGLFVILYAMSKIDAGKYAQLVSAMGGVFGKEKPGILQGQPGMLQSPIPQLQNERQKIEKEIQNALGSGMKKDLVSVSQNERGITIHIMEELLFSSGSAEFKASSLIVLDSLASVLKKIPNDIRIEGHTDNVPISTPQFPSNWHLSVARAVNAGYYLIQKHGVDAEKVSVVGYAEYRPLLPNTSDENRARNRRVDIVIITNVSHEPLGINNDHKSNNNQVRTLQ
ncbi:MAG TPA: flagellar motor protein MotB [Bacteroidota bacterium]|nr:flagellar motor protein MotB [Bacteroidota bacterium]